MLYKKSKYPAELLQNVELGVGELQLDVELGVDHQDNKKHTADEPNQTKKEICITLRVFYYVLIGLLLLSMIIICTIYISHLQTHVQQLDGQMKSLQESAVGQLSLSGKQLV